MGRKKGSRNFGGPLPRATDEPGAALREEIAVAKSKLQELRAEQKKLRARARQERQEARAARRAWKHAASYVRETGAYADALSALERGGFTAMT